MKFGVKPPEWVSHFTTTKHQQYMLDDIDREIGKREVNIDQLELELQQERFLLDWLCDIKKKAHGEVERSRSPEASQNLMNGVCSSPEPTEKSEQVHLDETPVDQGDEHTTGSHKDTTELEHSPTQILSSNSKSSFKSTDSTENPTVDQTSSCDTLDTDLSEQVPSNKCSPAHLRQRFHHQVDKSDARIARAVSRRLIEQGRHWSCQFLEDTEEAEEETLASSASSPAIVRRSASDPVKRHSESDIDSVSKSPKRHFASAVETPCPTGLVLTPEELKAIGQTSSLEQVTESQNANLEPETELEHSQETELEQTVKVEQESKLEEQESEPSKEDMLTDSEPKLTESESVSIVGKRNSNGIILDSLDTNKILALEDDEDENELLSSMGSRAQRTRTPRSSLDQSRIKIVRLSNGDLDGSPSHRYSKEDKENTRTKESDTRYQRHRNSLEYSSSHRHSMNLEDDECMTPKGELSMSLTPDSIDTLHNTNPSEPEQMLVERMDSLEDPTVTITRERVSLLQERHQELGRSATLTEESAKRMQGMISDLEAVSEEEKPESISKGTLTRERVQAKKDAEDTGLSFDRLDSLSEELHKALSQINTTPEMSMATLLDMDENAEMNERLQKSSSEHSSLEDLEIFESGEVDEATISAYTLRNDLFGSSTSIPSLFAGNESLSSTCSSPPDQPASPNHSTVNLRPSSGGRSRSRKRMGNADLDSIATAGSDSDTSPSHGGQSTGAETGDPITDDVSCVCVCVCVCARVYVLDVVVI